MAWKLRKDKLQEDAAKEQTGEAIGANTDETEEVPAAFSLNDTAVEELTFVPDMPETDAPAFHSLDLSGETHGHETSDEPRFASAEPSFDEPAFTAPPPQATPFTNEPSAFNPFVPYQPDEAPSAPQTSFDREEVAPGLISTGEEDDIPRVAPFIVDVPPADEEAVTDGTLLVRIGNLSANFTLTKDITTIGRPDSVAQSYPDVEIELDDAVSRRHAEIRRRGGEYYLVDMMSTNGTLLNGQRMAGDQEQQLLHGDQIRMGDRTEIIFE